MISNRIVDRFSIVVLMILFVIYGDRGRFRFNSIRTRRIIKWKEIKWKVRIYRNGDHISHPATYSYNSARISTFNELLGEIQNLKLFSDGMRITRLYTIDGRRINDKYAFENSHVNDFVATGPEGFMRIKGGYQNHIAYKKQQEENNISDKFSDQYRYRPESAEHHAYPNFYSRQSRQGSVFYPESDHLPSAMSRRLENRIENRADAGIVKKLYLYRNGDPHFKPKLYVYRSKIHRRWDKFLEGLDNMAPPFRGGGVRHLYTLRGKEVKSFDQLQHGKGYVVAGPDGFMDVKGGYASIGRTGRSSSSNPQPSSRPQTGFQSRPRTANPWPILRERLHERRLPEPTFFFVFKNGDGLQAQRFMFTPQQMEKGMAWVLEQIGRRFGIYPHKLVTMDNREITDVRQIINRGVYIIIPFGEKFTENWHHFPEMAVDTSVFRHHPDSISARRYSSLGSRPPSSRPRSHSSSLPPLGHTRHEQHDNDPHNFGRDISSDEERMASRGYQPDYHHKSHRENHADSGYDDRVGSASSKCSLCDMIERHIRKHRMRSQSVDDVNDVTDRTFSSKRDLYPTDTSPESDDKDKGVVSYSADDLSSILPPRPVTSRRVRLALSPTNIPDDTTYNPIRRSSLNDTTQAGPPTDIGQSNGTLFQSADRPQSQASQLQGASY